MPKGVQTFTKTGLTSETQYTLSINTEGPIGVINPAWVTNTATTSPVPPDSITALQNTTYLRHLITWTWTDPSPAGFDHVQVYLDGVWKKDVPIGTQTFMALGLEGSTAYTISTRTVGPSGVINQTWVNSTATTAQTPPESVTNLHNTTYQQTTITWNWTDPTSANFDRVRIYLNGELQSPLDKGMQSFTATGLLPSTAYNLSTRTIGNLVLVNLTWVNSTAITAPVPPDSITDLHNTTYQPTTITWNWTDPILG